MPCPPHSRLDPFDPPGEGWWEWGEGASRVWVRANSAEEARMEAEARLGDL